MQLFFNITLLLLTCESSLASFLVDIAESYFLDEIPKGRVEFTEVEKLGEGGFCDVWEVKYGENTYALKTVKASIVNQQEIDKAKATLDNEWDASVIWTNKGEVFPHGIILIYAVGSEVGTEDTVLLMEVLPGETLYFMNFEECVLTDKILSVGNELVWILEQLFFANVTHKDLKPENLQCENPNMSGLILFDFGLASYEDSFISSTATSGTYLFMSPDTQAGLGATPDADLWSLMIMLVLPVLKDKITWSDDATNIENLILKNSDQEDDLSEIERLNKEILQKKKEFEDNFESIDEIKQRQELLAVLLSIRNHIRLQEKPSNYSKIKDAFAKQLETFSKNKVAFNRFKSLQDV